MTSATKNDGIVTLKTSDYSNPEKMKYEDPHPLICILKSKGQTAEQFAESLGYKTSYIKMVIARWKRPGTKLAIRIEDATGISTSVQFRIPLKSEYETTES